jgi:hypothetical protein
MNALDEEITIVAPDGSEFTIEGRVETRQGPRGSLWARLTFRYPGQADWWETRTWKVYDGHRHWTGVTSVLNGDRVTLALKPA